MHSNRSVKFGDDAIGSSLFVVLCMKRPMDYVEFREQLPMSSAGKMLRRLLIDGAS